MFKKLTVFLSALVLCAVLSGGMFFCNAVEYDEGIIVNSPIVVQQSGPEIPTERIVPK